MHRSGSYLLYLVDQTWLLHYIPPRINDRNVLSAQRASLHSNAQVYNRPFASF
jgi:hypothetical protein